MSNEKNNGLVLPVQACVRGSTNVTVYNVDTGEIVYQHKDLPNMLTNAYFQHAIGLYGWLRWQTTSGIFMNRNSGAWPVQAGFVVFGKGGASVDRTNNTSTFVSPVYVNTNNAWSTRSDDKTHPIWITRRARSVAGGFVGDLTELGMGDRRTGTGGYTHLYARQLLPEAVPIAENYEIDVTWKLELAFGHSEGEPNRVWTGTIVNGQRPFIDEWDSGATYNTGDKVLYDDRNWISTADTNTTTPGAGGADWDEQNRDIVWRLTINDEQMMRHVTGSYDVNDRQLWGRTSSSAAGRARVRFGTSNDPTDMAEDGLTDLHGDEIADQACMQNWGADYAFDDATLTQGVKIGFEHTQFDGGGVPTDCSIGEIILTNGFARVTFDPPLDRAARHRLWLGYTMTGVDRNA